jgi:glycosyltransferase involved in cell wall biosynthesis
MHIGAILPHTLLYGGVKRFLELGNAFLDLGHKASIYTPTGEPPLWFDFKGEVKKFDVLANDNLDAVFFTETELIPIALSAKAPRKIFYFVYPKENLRIVKKHPEIEIFANSSNLVEIAKNRFGINAFPAIGGVNLKLYNPKFAHKNNNNSPFVVMAYGRLARSRKGTAYVVKACERIYRKGYNIELLLFDTPVNEKMREKNLKFRTKVPYSFVQNHPVYKNQELFHRADVFVSSERNAGWANTAAEAMASAIPVVGTDSGTKDFLFHEETGLIVNRNSRSISRAILRLLEDKDLAIRLAQNGRRTIEQFEWEVLAKKVLNHLE